MKKIINKNTTIEIQEEVQIGNIILEKGDRIEIQERDEFEYQLLGRLKADCEYSIRVGSIRRLWGVTVEDHIAKMRELYNGLREKPEWITPEDIDYYEKELYKIR